MTDLVEEALKLGFYAADTMDSSLLTPRKEVREMCAADRCHAYGKNWTCPPACGTLEESVTRLQKYNRVLLVQSRGELEDEFDFEGMMDLEKQHKERFHAMAEIVRRVHPDALCLGSGGCRICAKCAYPEPCRFPEKACSSMEAFGLLVSEVCTACGMTYYYGKNTLAYEACFVYQENVETQRHLMQPEE